MHFLTDGKDLDNYFIFTLTMKGLFQSIENKFLINNLPQFESHLALITS